MSTITSPTRRRLPRWPLYAIGAMIGILAARCDTQPDTSGPHAFMEGGATWACAPIHYQISDAELPDDFLPVVNGAIGKVSAASGFRFYYDGLTPDRDFAARLNGDTRLPLLIGFADATEETDFRDDTIGQASYLFDPNVGHFVAGVIKLDSTQYHDVSDLADRRAIVMHELGHMLGLGHVDDEGEIMNPYTTEVTEFGPGDLDGLKALFATSCPDGRTP